MDSLVESEMWALRARATSLEAQLTTAYAQSATDIKIGALLAEKAAIQASLSVCFAERARNEAQASQHPATIIVVGRR